MWRRSAVTVILLVIATIPTLPMQAQQKPFTQEQVANMVRDWFGDEPGAKLIEQRGIDFAPTEDFLQSLKTAGANEAFFAGLPSATRKIQYRHASYSGLPPAIPTCEVRPRKISPYRVARILPGAGRTAPPVDYRAALDRVAIPERILSPVARAEWRRHKSSREATGEPRRQEGGRS